MDEPITIPEDLSGLSDDELTTLGQDIRERVEALAEEARNSDESLAQVEGLISHFDRINDELAGRAEASAAREERLAAAMERFSEPAEEAVAEGEDEVEAEEAAAEEPTDESDEDETVEAATDEVAEAAIEDEVVVEAAADEAEVAEAATDTAEVAETAVDETEAVEAAVEEAAAIEAAVEAEAVTEAATDDIETQEVTEVASTNQATASRLANRRPDAVAPRPAPQVARTVTLAAARGVGGGIAEGANMDLAEVARVIAEKRHGMGSVPSGVNDRIAVASTALDFGENVVGGDATTNFSVLRQAAEAQRMVRSYVTSLVASGASQDDVREALSQESTLNALVASGGVCAPLEPNYDFFRLAEEQDPVERAIGTVGAPRGGIRYITPPDFRDAAAGVRITTEAEDAAGYASQGGPTADKPCVSVVCPPVQECRVDAVSRCVTFGNLNYRVFPEQVQAFLADLSVIFTETKEVFYLDAIDAASTAVTATQTYGAVRSIVNDLLRAAANYRRRHHMAANSVLQVLLPSWALEFLKVDMVNDHSLGLSFVDADMAQVTRFFAQANLDVSFYYDSATGAGQNFDRAQAAGAINDWPASLVSYMFAPGTFVRLDAGTLDVGLVRDSILNGTNDLQLFAEQWVQLCMVGLESLRIEHSLCPTGTGPEPVVPLTCGAGSS